LVEATAPQLVRHFRETGRLPADAPTAVREALARLRRGRSRRPPSFPVPTFQVTATRATSLFPSWPRSPTKSTAHSAPSCNCASSAANSCAGWPAGCWKRSRRTSSAPPTCPSPCAPCSTAAP
jgi:hypothetical protein